MDKNFCKVAENLNIKKAKIEEVLASISKEFSNEVNSYKVYEAEGAYWQYYPYTRTRFTRNFGETFKQQAMSVVECLLELQSSAKKENFTDLKMYECLIKHTFDYRRVQLIKSVAGVDVLPHIDNGREYVINIGLQNSNTCTTYISDSSVKDFWNEHPKSFIMQDNEAYIINADKTHAVKTHVSKDSNLDRYLITYMLTEC